MKITDEHYNHLKTVMSTFANLIKGHRDYLVVEGKAKDIEKRLRWDVLKSAVPSVWICDNLYPYINDTHIDTALRSIMKEIEV
jgi:O-methyltransferase involved in polyketide biosynthesis